MMTFCACSYDLGHDSDGDGYLDGADDCPYDPYKIIEETGIDKETGTENTVLCGCNKHTVYVDADGHILPYKIQGYPDICVDNIIEDSDEKKILDSDGDGIPDDDEDKSGDFECKFNASRYKPGECDCNPEKRKEDCKQACDAQKVSAEKECSQGSRCQLDRDNCKDDTSTCDSAYETCVSEFNKKCANIENSYKACLDACMPSETCLEEYQKLKNTDSDGDDKSDLMDGCPYNKCKTAHGACGCEKQESPLCKDDFDQSCFPPSTP